MTGEAPRIIEFVGSRPIKPAVWELFGDQPESVEPLSASTELRDPSVLEGNVRPTLSQFIRQFGGAPVRLFTLPDRPVIAGQVIQHDQSSNNEKE